MATIYLVCGYKGSGKSTLIRWLSSLSEKSRVDWLTGGFLPSETQFVGENFQQQNARSGFPENFEVKWHQLAGLLGRKSAHDIFVHLDMTYFFIRMISSQSNSEIQRILSSKDLLELRQLVKKSIDGFLTKLMNQSQLEVRAILLEAKWKDSSDARRNRCMQPRKSALIQIVKSPISPETIRRIYSALRGLLRCYTFTWRGHNRVVWGRKYGPEIHSLMYEKFARAIIGHGIDLTRVARRENLPPAVVHSPFVALGSKFVSKVTIGELGQ
jgi:hypothetical protein